MKKQHSQTEKRENIFVLAIGAIIHFFIILYGGNEKTQKSPIKFIAYCISMIAIFIGIIMGIIYLIT